MSTAQRPASSPPKASIPDIAAGAIGAAMIGAAPRDGRGRMARLAGLALVGIAARRLLRETVRDIGDRRREIVQRSSIEIERSIADVFAFLNDFENLPRVIGNLRSVIDYQDGRAHWEAYAPSGKVVEWDTVITKYVPRSVIAWESTEGSEFRVTAVVRFTALSPTRTRVDLELSHRPPHTGLREAIRSLFGPAQGKQMKADLEHARYYLESLAPPAAVEPERSSEPPPSGQDETLPAAERATVPEEPRDDGSGS